MKEQERPTKQKFPHNAHNKIDPKAKSSKVSSGLGFRGVITLDKRAVAPCGRERALTSCSFIFSRCHRGACSAERQTLEIWNGPPRAKGVDHRRPTQPDSPAHFRPKIASNHRKAGRQDGDKTAELIHTLFRHIIHF